jgi:hypothetical protein
MGGPVLQIGKIFLGACSGPVTALFCMAGVFKSSNHIVNWRSVFLSSGDVS